MTSNNLEILQSVTGVPWDPQATRDDVPEGPRPAIVVGEPAEPLAQPVVVQAPKPKTSRRLYITKRGLGEIWIYCRMPCV